MGKRRKKLPIRSAEEEQDKNHAAEQTNMRQSRIEDVEHIDRGKGRIKKIINFLCTSILFNSLRIVAVLTILLMIFYLVSPKSAYVTMRQAADSVEINDGRLNLLTWSGKDIAIREFDRIVIKPQKSWTHGEQILDGDCYAVINPEDSGAAVFINGDLSGESFHGVVTNEIPAETQNAMGLTPTQEQIDKILGRQSLRKKENGDIRVEGSSGLRIWGSSALRISPYNARVDIYQGTKIIHSYSAEDSDIIGVADFYDLSVECDGGYFIISSYESLNGIFTEIENIKVKGTGELVFQYSSNSDRRETLNQVIEIGQSQKQMSVSIEQVDGDVMVSYSGLVNIANLSEVSLFPNFLSWFRETAFLLPTTILTVISGAISLIGKKK